MLTHSAALPRHAAILYAILSLDAKGVPHVEDEGLARLHEVANAPIFGLRSTQLGRGIVGGPLLSMEDLSRTTTDVARRLLRREAPRTIATPTQMLAAPAFDWRELRRWGIDGSRLPRESAVHFQEPTIWRQYRRSIVAIASLAGVQALLVVGLVVNLSRRRRAEQSLRESEARFRLLSDAAPVMLWVSGPDKLCTDFNRAWLDFTGRPLEAHLGNGWMGDVHGDDLSSCLETYKRAFDRRESFRTEYRLLRHDGEFRWILDTAMPRFLANGVFGGYVGSAIDITDLRLATKGLASLSHRLMQTHEEERAWVARELQEDLCQQMTALTMRLHGLSQSPVGDDVEMRSRVATLSGQFAHLQRGLLAISDQLYSSKLALLGLAAAVRIFCKELSEQHAIRFDVRDEGVPGDLPSDVALSLFRMMQEALRNAAKHSAARLVTVRLCGSPTEIHVEVVDEGVGFDPDVVMRHEGLGLIAMRERVRLVGGDSAVESRPGSGTRIRARVPLACVIGAQNLDCDRGDQDLRTRRHRLLDA